MTDSSPIKSALSEQKHMCIYIISGMSDLVVNKPFSIYCKTIFPIFPKVFPPQVEEKGSLSEYPTKSCRPQRYSNDIRDTCLAMITIQYLSSAGFKLISLRSKIKFREGVGVVQQPKKQGALNHLKNMHAR